MVKKYWSSFLTEHIHKGKDHLLNQGFNTDYQSEAVLIRELIIAFLWIITNTYFEDDAVREHSEEIEVLLHNIYLNDHNHEDALAKSHEEQLGYDTHYKIPQVEMPRVISRYAQYDKLLKSGIEHNFFGLYESILRNMMPIDDLDPVYKMYFIANLHKFIEALRADYKTFILNNYN